MKKLLLFLLTAVCAVSSARAEPTTIFDATAAGWSASGVDLTTGTTTVGACTWHGGGSATIGNGAIFL